MKTFLNDASPCSAKELRLALRLLTKEIESETRVQILPRVLLFLSVLMPLEKHKSFCSYPSDMAEF